MNRYFLPIILFLAFPGLNSCTTEQAQTNSGSVGASPDRGVVQTAPTPLTATETSIPSSPITPDSTPSPVVTSTRESTSPRDRRSESKVIRITDGNYEEEVSRTQMPVLIQFGAPWSGPVRIMGPTFEAVANEYAGRVKVGEVNIDESPDLARKFDIKGIPTLVIIKNGSERERVIGVTFKEKIGRLLEKQLGSNP